VGLVEVETAAVAEAPAVEAAPVVVAARAAAADRVEDLEVVGRVVEAEPEEAGELVAGPVRRASRASGWPRQQCSREGCLAEFRE